MSDSDDKRPRFYTNLETSYGRLELTVQGAEGETAAELASVFDERLGKALDAQRGLEGDDGDEKKEVH